MQFNIDCSGISSVSELHSRIADTLHFPEWYGGNLDALNDCLTDIHEPTEIIFYNFDIFKADFEKYANNIVRMTRACAAENSNLSFEFK